MNLYCLHREIKVIVDQMEMMASQDRLCVVIAISNNSTLLRISLSCFKGLKGRRGTKGEIGERGGKVCTVIQQLLAIR